MYFCENFVKENSKNNFVSFLKEWANYVIDFHVLGSVITLLKIDCNKIIINF